MADNKKITELDGEYTPLKTDYLTIVDDPGGTPITKKIRVHYLFTAINDLDAETAPATGDVLLMYDVSQPEANKVTFANLLKVIDGLTELAEAPAAADTLVVLDDGTPKKVQFSNLGIGGGGQARKSLPIAGCYLPDDSANNAAAQLQLKTSSGGTLHPAWVEAVFDKDTDEHIMFCFLMPDNYSSAPIVDVYYKLPSETANDVCFAAAIMAVTDGDSQDVDADVFDTANAQADTVPGTAGHMGVCSITMTNADSVAANDLVVLVVFRDVSGDGVGEDVEVPLVVLRYTST